MKYIITFFSALLLSFSALAEIKTEEINYKVGDQSLTGYLAWDDAITTPRPGVLVVHEWWGHNPYARKRAEMLAELGYTGFALDMYGSGVLATHPKDAKKFMQAITGDAEKTKQRFDAAHQLLLEHETVDKTKSAAIGYCMGGGISLNMARAGADLDAVVSFHGGLGSKSPAQPGDIKAKILVLTGAADPMAPAEQVAAFEKEMTEAKADFKLKSYPGVKHSFTNPDADKFGKEFGLPLAYDADADKDSWQEMQNFLEAAFK